MRSLAAILQEADRIIEKRAAEAAPPPAVVEEDEIFKLAEQVRTHVSQIERPQPTRPTEFSYEEKLAYAMAITETVLSARPLAAMAKFEKEAREKGFTDEQIQEFFSKAAASTGAGGKVFNFMTGMGEGLEGYIKSIPTVDMSLRGAGRAIGAAAPLAGAAAVGASYGADKARKDLGVG